MRYLKMLLAAVLILGGCSVKKEQTPIKVLSPTGAPSLSLLEAANAESENIFDFVTGSEALSAELVKENSEYDIILAPVNLGAKMIENGKSVYRLKAVITWGNLYIVGSENALNEEGVFASFGEGSVVDFVLKNAVDMDALVPAVEMYSSAQDVQGAILSGNADCGMLAEPAVTATVKKAKEQGIELQVLMNLQTAYKEKMNTQTEGFPQAAIFVKEGSEDKCSELLKAIEKFVNDTAVNNPDQIEALVDQLGADTLGVPSAALSKATWMKQNIRYVEASECKKDLTTLLSLMNIEFKDEMLSK